MKYHILCLVMSLSAGLSAMQQPSAHDFATQPIAYVTDEVTGNISFSPGTKQALWVFMHKALIQKGLMTQEYAQTLFSNEGDYCRFMPAQCTIADMLLLLTFEPGNQTITRELLQVYKADPNAAIYGGVTCLFLAVEMNNIPLVTVMLEDPRTDPNKGPLRGLCGTLLHLAARSPDRLAIAKLLLEHPKIGVQRQDTYGITPLCVALKHKNIPFLELAVSKRKALRDAGAETTPYDELVSNDFFYIAACQSSVSAFRLIEKARQD